MTACRLTQKHGPRGPQCTDMGLFSRKEKVDTAQFCRDLYDKHVFESDKDESELHMMYCKTVQNQIALEDPPFGLIDIYSFADEMLALRMEVIGVAWSHKLGENSALTQSEFTKSYLLQEYKDYVWDHMSEYNQIVAQSATYGADTSTGAGRMRVTFINQMRIKLFDGWAEGARDTEAAARVANRLGTEATWKVTRSLLAMEMAERLGHEGPDETLAGLTAVTEGFYRGAADAIKEVKIIA